MNKGDRILLALAMIAGASLIVASGLMVVIASGPVLYKLPQTEHSMHSEALGLQPVARSRDRKHGGPRA